MYTYTYVHSHSCYYHMLNETHPFAFRFSLLGKGCYDWRKGAPPTGPRSAAVLFAELPFVLVPEAAAMEGEWGREEDGDRWRRQRQGDEEIPEALCIGSTHGLYVFLDLLIPALSLLQFVSFFLVCLLAYFSHHACLLIFSVMLACLFFP